MKKLYKITYPPREPFIVLWIQNMPGAGEESFIGKVILSNDNWYTIGSQLIFYYTHAEELKET